MEIIFIKALMEPIRPIKVILMKINKLFLKIIRLLVIMKIKGHILIMEHIYLMIQNQKKLILEFKTIKLKYGMEHIKITFKPKIITKIQNQIISKYSKIKIYKINNLDSNNINNLTKIRMLKIKKSKNYKISHKYLNHKE